MIGSLENKHFYIYAYLDPRKNGKYKYVEYKFKNEPFYIGKGHKNRDITHLKNAYKKDSPFWDIFFYRKIRKIKREINKDPIIFRIKEGLTDQESLDLETEIIKIIGRINLKRGPLTNLTDGGDGTAGRIVSDETRKKISKSRKGIKLSKEHIEAIINANKGRIISDYQKKKIRIANSKRKYKPHTEETKRKISEHGKGKHLGPFSEKHRKNISKAKKGKELSNEHKKKISKASKLRKHTEETKKKISRSNKRKKQKRNEKQIEKLIKMNKSKEHKLKVSKFQTGRKKSKETRKKLSKSLKGKVSGFKCKIHKSKTKKKMSKSQLKRFSKRNPLWEIIYPNGEKKLISSLRKWELDTFGKGIHKVHRKNDPKNVYWYHNHKIIRIVEDHKKK